MKPSGSHRFQTVEDVTPISFSDAVEASYTIWLLGIIEGRQDAILSSVQRMDLHADRAFIMQEAFKAGYIAALKDEEGVSVQVADNESCTAHHQSLAPLKTSPLSSHIHA